MESNKLIASISALFLLFICSCSNQEARMAKLHEDHVSKYQSQLAAQEDSLRLADSLLLVVTPLANDLIASAGFVFEKNEFDELGRFLIKGTEADANLSRNYLHATVNEYGVTQLISEYRGSHAANHVQIRVSATDGTQCTSTLIPQSQDGANYRFQNQGTFHETVTFTADSTLSFIDLHKNDKQLKVELLNQNHKTITSYNINKTQIKPLADSYQLGVLLAAQLHYSQLSKIASQKIQLFKAKLETKE